MEKRMLKVKVNTGVCMINGVLRREGELLIADKTGLITMIRDNTDKESVSIDANLIKMIQCFYGKMSIKQTCWLLEKVKYIIRHNWRYYSFKGVKDIQFV
jgi:hypothetical protein